MDAARWADYFSSVVVRGERYLATVEVHPERLVGRRPGVLRPLVTIGYDAERDVLEVAVGDGPGPNSEVRYFVSSPRAIQVEESGDTRAIIVDDASGVRTLVRLFRCTPLLRPSKRRALIESFE